MSFFERHSGLFSQDLSNPKSKSPDLSSWDVSCKAEASMTAWMTRPRVNRSALFGAMKSRGVA